MKHSEYMKPGDQADMLRAAEMVAGGKKLRSQVFARLRARAFRKRMATAHKRAAKETGE
jgi:hypothetical protein